MIQRFVFRYNEAGDGNSGGGGNADAGQAAGGTGSAGNAGGTTLFGGDAGASGASAGSDAGGSPGAWGGLIAADGTFSEAWWEKAPEELKEDAKALGAKGMKDIPSLVKGYRGLEQLLGKKADAVIVPGPDSPPDVIAKFREKLGVPEDPKGYKLGKPEKLPEGVEWDQARVDDFAKLAHELSLTPQQVAKLQEWDMKGAEAGVSKTREAIIATEKAELQKQEQELTRAWGNGPEFTKNKELATRAALTAGFTMEQLNSDPIFRNAGVVKALAKLGSLMSEDSLAKGAANEGFNDGYSKAMDIINNSQNPLYQRYHNGDETVRSMVQEGLKRKK